MVAAEALAHIDHAASVGLGWVLVSRGAPRRLGTQNSLALAQALAQLLALGRQLLGQRRAEAFAGSVTLDHDAVGFLEALREGLT